MDNAFVKFWAEFFTRIFSKKPRFFEIVQWVGVSITGLSLTIGFLSTKDIVMPDWVSVVGDTTFVIGGVVAMIIAQLPNSKE
jgi:hypothetical protein